MIGPKNLVLSGTVVLAALFLIFGSPAAHASDIYVAQNAAGNNNGADCSDAYSAAWFNTPGSWGSNSGQIGPGTTVHLCGTFNMSAGASGVLAFQGSGNSGNPIVLKFEAGANATAPYWGVNGFITAAGKSYITVDGGSNGTIQATANGVGLSNQVGNGNAIYFTSVSNAEVKNLTCANMFVAVQNASNNETTGGATSCIWWDNGSNVTIDGNTFHDVFYGVYKPYESGNSNYNISNNTIYNISTGIVVGSGNTGATLSGANTIHDNVIHDTGLWDAPGDANHHDYIHIWAVQSGTNISDMKVYNNYLYGTGGCCMTAYLYIECSGGCSVPGITTEVFNNVIYNSDASSDLSTGAGGNGEMECEGSTCFIGNNTFVGVTTSSCCTNTGIHFENGSTVTLKGNVYSTLAVAIAGSGGTIAASDYQDAYNMGNFFIFAPSGGCSSGCSFASWQAGGQDAHSTTGNPALSAAFQLGSTSAARQASTNLTSMNIAPLNIDKAGVPRPSTGNWDMGAYESSAGQAAQPAAPAGLQAIVQ